MTRNTEEGCLDMTSETKSQQPLQPISSSKFSLRNLMNRIASSPRARQWMAKFPLTRAISRKQSQDLFDLCAGFVYTQILYSFVETRLHTALAESPMTVTEIARHTNLNLDVAERLIRGATSLGLAVQRGDGRYDLGLKGAALIDNPGVIDMILHHAKVYRDLTDPLALMRGDIKETETGAFWSYLAEDRHDSMTQETTNVYSDLMASSQTMIAEIVTSSFNFNAYKNIVDIGGGTGTFMEHVAKVAPASTLSIFDLPQVAVAANERLGWSGLGDRITAIGGDFKHGDLPNNADLMTLVRVAYDHPDSTVLELLAKIHSALPKGGKLLIAEPFAGDRAHDRTADAYFNFYLLAMGSGRVRTFHEHQALLSAAGFSSVSRHSTINPALAQLALATK
jgi:demethylspheroidene O-methyltransferase